MRTSGCERAKIETFWFSVVRVPAFFRWQGGNITTDEMEETQKSPQIAQEALCIVGPKPFALRVRAKSIDVFRQL